MTILLWSLLISFAINIAMFLVAFRLRSDKLTDASYALTFIVLAIFAFVYSNKDILHWVLLMMILLWALRIGGFLLYRVIKTGKDARFDSMRENFFKFSKFWLGQALTVWVLMIPATLAFLGQGSVVWFTVAGFVIWLIGLCIEATADLQKYLFSQNPANKGRWIDSGVWHYSRHPNYFGEILIWVGIYLCALSALAIIGALVGLISPLFITVLLLFVTGIPILEKSADKRWGDDPAYQRYKQRTSILVPLPKR